MFFPLFPELNSKNEESLTPSSDVKFVHKNGKPVDFSNCLTEDRHEAIKTGQLLTQGEHNHIKNCDWCSYLVIHGHSKCFTNNRLKELAFGDSITKMEENHLKKCPICKWEFEEISTNG